MQRFKQFLRESVIDLPRKTFAKGVFDQADTDNPKLKPKVKKMVNAQLDKFRQVAPIKNVKLIGSIVTKKYKEDADLDINVLFDASEKELEKLQGMAGKVNGKEVRGTEHPVNYFVLNSQKMFNTANEFADAVYDIEKEKFDKRADLDEVDIDRYMDAFRDEVDSIDIAAGELERDLIDLKQLKSFGRDEIKDLSSRVADKIEELEQAAAKIIDAMDDSAQDRRDIFKRDLTPEEIREYGSHNRLPTNVIFKMLERYHYKKLAKTLKDIIGDDGKLSGKEVDKLIKKIDTIKVKGESNGKE